MKFKVLKNRPPGTPEFDIEKSNFICKSMYKLRIDQIEINKSEPYIKGGNVVFHDISFNIVDGNDTISFSIIDNGYIQNIRNSSDGYYCPGKMSKLYDMSYCEKINYIYNLVLSINRSNKIDTITT